MDKAALCHAIIAQLETELAGLIAAANASKAEATDQDSRQEGKFDMRGQSAAYLAEGQTKLAAELAPAIAAYHNLKLEALPEGSVAILGAVVTLEAQKQKTVYFIGPARGGMDVETAGTTVTVITAVSPLGRQLIGKRVGNSVMAGARAATIVSLE